MVRTATQTIVIDKVKKFGVWPKVSVFNQRPSHPVLAYWRDHGRHSVTIYLDQAPAGISRSDYIRSEVATQVAKLRGGGVPVVELSVKAARTVARKWR